MVTKIAAAEIEKLIANRKDWYVIHALRTGVLAEECISKVGIIQNVTGKEILNNITDGNWKLVDYTDSDDEGSKDMSGSKLDGNCLTFLKDEQTVSWVDEETGVSVLLCPTSAITKMLQDF